MRSTKAFLFGAGAAYLFDPRLGKRRRNILRDRSAAVARKTVRVGARKARFAGGHARGALALARRVATPPDVPMEDHAVVQRIRSQTLREVGVSVKDVEVEVEDGVAILRGAVDGRARADELVGRVSKVPGVQDVAVMIRVSNGETG